MIWVAGAQGMLGKRVVQTLSVSGLTVISTDKEMDITDPDACQAFLSDHAVQWIVNCAAYTAVDKAEDEPDTAFRLNADGPGTLARLAQRNGARLIHISTDYVFKGDQETQCNEDDPAAPVSVYGKSKRKGELRVIENCTEHFTIRTAWMYGLHGPNFVYTMLKLMKNLDEIKVVNDQTGSPTYARDLSGFIGHVIRKDSRDYGIYHFTNSGRVTWYGFAEKIYELGRETGLVKNECTITPCSTEEFPTKAVRPRYSLLSKEKVRSVFGVVPPDWNVSLEEFVHTLAASGHCTDS